VTNVRICSFLPSATEMIYSLGLDRQLYGVTHECDFPKDAITKPKLTRNKVSSPTDSSNVIDFKIRNSLKSGEGIYEIIFENLSTARPDIILTQKLCEVCAVSYGEIFRVASKLSSNPEIISLDTFNLEDILSAITLVGEKCGAPHEANNLVTSLRKRIANVKQLARRTSGGGQFLPRVFFVEWIDPIMTSGHWVPELVKIAGGMDGLGNQGKNSRTIEWSEVRQYAPDFIIVAPCGFGVERAEKEVKVLRNLEGWKDIPAVRKGNVYVADGNAYFSRPGPRIIDGLEILATILRSDVTEFRERYGALDFKKISV